MSHTCHAHKCTTPLAPKYFMCPRHWCALPGELQREIWKHYRKGQERDKNPSLAYVQVTNKAKLHIAETEYPQDAEGLKSLYARIENAFRKREREINFQVSNAAELPG